jgi:hypothetical protein
MKNPDSARLRVDRDEVAAILSLVPGAGHLYKHHYALGLGLLLGGNLLVAFAAGLMAFGTLGLSLVLLPLVYIGVVAWSAFNLPDWHGHHAYLHPWAPDTPPADDEHHGRD